MVTNHKLNAAQRDLLLRLFNAGGAGALQTRELHAARELRHLGLVDLDHDEAALTAAGCGVAGNLATEAAS
jgi:hypothetical protein